MGRKRSAKLRRRLDEPEGASQEHTRKVRTARRDRYAIYLVSCLAILGVAAFLFARPYIEAARTKSIENVLMINMAGWQPGVVRAEAGKPLDITIVNLDNQFHLDGGGWHDFVIDDLDIDWRVAPKDTATFRLVVDEPGEYTFWCTICCGGRESPIMSGTLIVS
jgi:plastocyanin